MREQKFRKLVVWSKAMDFIELIYKTTHKFPSSEIYGLTSQIRRASTSIALNIAEGSGSGTDKEFCRFLSIALRSSYEVVCGVEVAKRLNYCSSNESDILLKLCDELSAMITGLKKSIS